MAIFKIFLEKRKTQGKKACFLKGGRRENLKKKENE